MPWLARQRDGDLLDAVLYTPGRECGRGIFLMRNPQRYTQTKVGRLVGQYLEFKRPTVGPRTLRRIAVILDRFIIHAANTSTISRQSIILWRQYTATSLRWSDGTLVLADMVVRTFCDWAERRGLIEPGHHDGLPARTARFVKRKTVTRETLGRLLAAAGDRLHVRHLILLGYYTGMAIRDCCMLRWENIDYEMMAIRIERSKTMTRCTIPFTPSGDLHESLLACANAWPKIGHDALVCPPLAELYGSGDTDAAGVRASLAFRKVCEDAGVEGITFHSFRASMCSALAQNGVNYIRAMQITGHKSARVFERYTDHNPDILREAVDRALSNRA